MSIDFSTVTSVTIPEGDVVQIAIGGSTVWKRQPPAGYWEVTRSDGTAPTAGTMWVVRLSDGATGYYAFATETFTAVSFAVGDVVGHDDIMFSVDVDIQAGHMSQYVSLNGGTYKCVCWGDGTVSAVASGAFAVSHTYATAGTYNVKTYAVEPTAIAYWGTAYADNRVSAINNAVPWATLGNFTKFMANAQITSVPAGIFSNCTNMSIFTQAFTECKKLKTVEGNLFTSTPVTTDLSYIFYLCEALETVHKDTFKYCTNLLNLRSAFARCYALTAIPAEIFADCPNVNNFLYCFQYDSAVTGSLPELWNTHASAQHTNCFTGCTQATNYADAQQAGWA